jgi:hypothetical protein
MANQNEQQRFAAPGDAPPNDEERIRGIEDPGNLSDDTEDEDFDDAEDTEDDEDEEAGL